MINYQNSKTSIHIEEQLPFPAKANGDAFKNFLKTYYDWLERRVIIVECRSDFDILETDFEIGEYITGQQFLIGMDDSSIILSDNANEENIYTNLNSIKLGGYDAYVDVDHSIIDVSNDWSLFLFLNLKDLPSILREDFDIITLSHTHYMSVVKIFKDSNQLGFNITGSDETTNIDIKKDNWYGISVRYSASNNTIYYDVFTLTDHYSYEKTITFPYSSDRFVVGCDLYNSRNFSYALLDEIGIWNKKLSDTEIISIYNDGSAINLQENILNYESSSNLTNYYRFEGNTEDLINSSNNGTAYGRYSFDTEVSYNLDAFLYDNDTGTFSVKILSYRIYENVLSGQMTNRILLFVEFYSGNIEANMVFKNLNSGPLIISSIKEVKNPLYVANNIENFQEVDYVCNQNNFIKNNFFSYFWKEFSGGENFSLASIHESSIRNIILKSFPSFYKTKGTKKSFIQFFKIFYNEDIQIVEKYLFDSDVDVFDSENTTFDSEFIGIQNNNTGSYFITNDTYEYTIMTKYYSSTDLKKNLKNLCHPVGFKMNLISS